MKVLAAFFAILFGLVVLMGYFIEYPLLSVVRNALLQYAIILAAVALIVGVGNFFISHWRKASEGKKGSGYSVLILFAFSITVVVAGAFGPTASWSLWIFDNLQVPVERSLVAILAVVLTFSAVRLLRRQFTWQTALFMLTLFLVLLGSIPLLGVEVPGLYGTAGVKEFIVQVLALGGARGILLGVALGAIATGLRVLLGADRPYKG